MRTPIGLDPALWNYLKSAPRLPDISKIRTAILSSWPQGQARWGTSARRRRPWFNTDSRLRHLDEVGVTRQVLSWTGATYDGLLSPEEARPLWKAQNDDLGAVVKKFPQRFFRTCIAAHGRSAFCCC